MGVAGTLASSCGKLECGPTCDVQFLTRLRAGGSGVDPLHHATHRETQRVCLRLPRRVATALAVSVPHLA